MEYLLPQMMTGNEEYARNFNDPLFMIRALRKPKVKSTESFSICAECKRVWENSSISSPETKEGKREYAGRLCPDCLSELFGK